MGLIDIKGLDKAEVLFYLYNHSHPQGLGIIQEIMNTRDLTLEDCEKDYQESQDKYFDYYYGRVLKVDLSGDEFDSWLYDRDCGEGAAKKAINELRASKNANS